MSAVPRRDYAAPTSLIADSAARQRQVRRAWLILSLALSVTVLVCALFGGAAYWYRGHATVKKSALIEVVQGDRAYTQGARQTNWNTVPPGTATSSLDPRQSAGLNYLHEGESLRVEEGTRVLLTLWDGSKVEVFERTQIHVKEMQTTQYINRASAFSIEQTRGLLRVTLSPGDYSRSRFQVAAGQTTVLMKEGSDRTAGGSFLVEVTPAPDGESLATVRASVRRGVGVVRAGGQEVRLNANEQTIVPPASPPESPTLARRDLVANGTFTLVSNDAKGRFASWQEISTPGQRDGAFGRLAVVQDTLDGRPVSALECYRSLDSTDPAITGLRQTLGVTVADVVSLELTANIKVLEQNVPGGGVAGSEYPMIVRINYRDAAGAERVRVWGFYILPDPSGARPANGQLVTAGAWTPLRINLRDLTPQPVRLDSIEIYASGHGYRARITEVAIIGVE